MTGTREFGDSQSPDVRPRIFQAYDVIDAEIGFLAGLAQKLGIPCLAWGWLRNPHHRAVSLLAATGLVSVEDLGKMP
jgi:hypothetical protein